MRRPRTKATHAPAGFAIPLASDTDLGLAVLVAEDEEGAYEPISVVRSIKEAREIASDLLGKRMRRLERGGDPGRCPHIYKLWAWGVDGDYRVAAEIDPMNPEGR
jgi:hypothetical protein